MTPPDDQFELEGRDVSILQRRARVLLLLNAAERAGVAPLTTVKLHAFAYLADVLSPVWDLPAFDGAVLKISGGPFYRDLQTEVDRLAVMGLLEVFDLKYVERPRNGARIDARYSLNFPSSYLPSILDALGAGAPDKAIDEADLSLNVFLVELAGALALLPDDEIGAAATADVTYDDPRVGLNNLVEFEVGPIAAPENLSAATAHRFNEFVPRGIRLSSGRSSISMLHIWGEG